MFKELAFLVGGIYIASKLNKNTSDEGVVPSTTYDSVSGMDPVDFEQVRNRLMAFTDNIIDPVARQQMINQIGYWIEAGFSELQIRNLIEQSVSIADQVGDDIASIMPVDLGQPINTDFEIAAPDPQPVPQEVFAEAIINMGGGVPDEYQDQVYAEIQKAMDYGINPFDLQGVDVLALKNFNDPMIVYALGPDFFDRLRFQQ